MLYLKIITFLFSIFKNLRKLIKIKINSINHRAGGKTRSQRSLTPAVAKLKTIASFGA